MRKEKPTGKEIAEKSKKVKLSKPNSFMGQIKGKRIWFTPSKMPSFDSLDELEEGQIIGVLETELESDKLPAGKYNIFIDKEKGEWHGYLEAEGNIIAEADEVSVERHYLGDHKVEKPKFEFTEGSFTFCFWICLYRIFIWCVARAKICIYIP